MKTISSVVLAAAVGLLALAPLEFAQTTAQPTGNGSGVPDNGAVIINEAGPSVSVSPSATLGPPPPPPPPPPPVATASNSSRGSSRRGATGTATARGFSAPAGTPTAMEVATLNLELRTWLSSASPDCKKLLDANPTYQPLGTTMPAGIVGNESILNNAIRDLLAKDPAAKAILDAHPHYNLFAPATAALARRGSSPSASARGRSAATPIPAVVTDRPTAIELATLNTALRNQFSLASNNARLILGSHPNYNLLGPTFFSGPTGAFGSAGSSGRRGFAATSAPLTTGRGSSVTPGGNGLGGQN